jgi:hypothetical protein
MFIPVIGPILVALVDYDSWLVIYPDRSGKIVRSALACADSGDRDGDTVDR